MAPQTAESVELPRLDAAEMRTLLQLVVDRVVEHWTGLSGRPAVVHASPEELAELGGPPPMQPAALEDSIRLLADVALNAMQHSAHPRYFARVPGPASLPAILGDWLSTGFNAIASSWGGGAGPSYLELVVVDWLRQLLGFPEGTEGVLVSGGSLGNLTALAAARTAGYGSTVYLSDQTHASIARGLRMLGWADRDVHVVPTGPDHAWTSDVVSAAVARGSARPIVVATAGTTNTGAVDPLDSLASICSDADAWLHVDGAYGAPAALAPSGRAALAGIDRADSLTIDPHKWLFQPYDIGCVLVRRPGALEACFAMNPEYLRDVQSSDEERVDLRNRGPELSRRGRAVKLWLTFKTYGVPAIAAAVDRGIRLAETVEGLLRDDPYWEVTTPAQVGVLTFAARGVSNAEHDLRAQRLTDSGYAAVSCTQLRGRTVFRLCLINPHTTVDDVMTTVGRLRGNTSR